MTLRVFDRLPSLEIVPDRAPGSKTRAGNARKQRALCRGIARGATTRFRNVTAIIQIRVPGEKGVRVRDRDDRSNDRSLFEHRTTLASLEQRSPGLVGGPVEPVRAHKKKTRGKS